MQDDLCRLKYMFYPQRKIISMEEKKQLHEKEMQNETHTKKSWNSSYTGGLGASWIKKEENLSKWEMMLWRKKRYTIMQIIVQWHKTRAYKFYLWKTEWLLARLENAKLSSSLQINTMKVASSYWLCTLSRRMTKEFIPFLPCG